jgi:hypothetical protein
MINEEYEEEISVAVDDIIEFAEHCSEIIGDEEADPEEVTFAECYLALFTIVRKQWDDNEDKDHLINTVDTSLAFH